MAKQTMMPSKAAETFVAVFCLCLSLIAAVFILPNVAVSGWAVTSSVVSPGTAENGVSDGASNSITDKVRTAQVTGQATGQITGLGKPTDFPELTGRVVDLAGILNAQEEASLVAKLAAFEDRSSDQLVVATIASLNGKNIDEYANQLFRHWNLGQAQENNGVLLLVAVDDRKLRIEVGYGLEGILTDAASKTIIDAIIVPAFKTGQFGKGVSDGADMIISVLSGDSAELEARARRNPASGNDEIDWPTVLFITIWATLFFGPIAIAILVPMFGKKLGPGHYKWLGIEVKPARSSGRSGGSWGSGGGWSSGGGGGGFSGGGGSSGGGGASGGW